MIDSNSEDSYSKFNPRAYIDYYYSTLNRGNSALLKFYAKAFSDIPQNAVLLEFGGGPTIHQLISTATKVKEIHFSDYLERNLEEVKDWQKQKGNSFNWTPYFKKALQLEGEKNVTAEKIKRREALVRQKITKFLPSDAFLDNPLGYDARGKYDVVATGFVPEGITSSKVVWKKLIARITSLLKPNGIFITASLRNAEYWSFDELRAPACPVTETDMIKTLSGLSFRQPCTMLKVIKVRKYPNSYFRGAFFLKAVK